MDKIYLDALIIGNGFDINLKQKTKYSDFHNIIKEILYYVYNLLQLNIEQLVEKWKNQGYLHINKELLPEFIKIVTEKKNNFFIQYFYNALFGEWNDLEKELEKIYKTFDMLFDSLSAEKRVELGNNYYIINDLYKLPAFHIFDYVKEFGDYEFKIDNTNNCGNFIDKKYNTYVFNIAILIGRIKEIKKNISELLFKDLEDFSNIFSLYLKTFTLIDNIRCTSLKVDTIFTYNYTCFANEVLNPEITLYIHGKLNSNVDKNSSNNGRIVFGIDDRTEFHNKEFEKFKKTIIRSLYDTDIKMLKVCLDNLEPHLVNYEESMNIGVIGHSLDLIDEDSLKMIFEKEFDNFYIFYYDDKAKTDLIINLRKILGVGRYNNLFNANKINYINVSELNFSNE